MSRPRSRGRALRAAWLGLGAALCGAAPAVAQHDAVGRLRAADPQVVENARRELCVTAAPARPVEPLAALLRDPEPAVVAAAASVLAHWGDDVAAAARRGLATRPEPALQRLALPLLDAAAVRAWLTHGAPALRRAALAEWFDRGSVTAAEWARALADADESVAAAALRLLLDECAPFPVAMLDALTPVARSRLWRGLAERPRAATAAWLEAQLQREGLAIEDRLRVFTALPRAALDVRRGRDIFAAASDPARHGAAVQAARRLLPAVVDKLVATAHQQVAVGGVPIDALLPCLENATALGDRQMLALSRVLRPADVESICQWLAARGSTGLRDHVAAALEGEVPLEKHLLRRAGPLLDTPRRIARVVELLADADAELARLAFYELIEAQVYRPEMLEFALVADEEGDAWSDRAQRLRGLAKIPLRRMPAEFVQRLLGDHDVHVQRAVCRALVRSPYPESVETALLRLARGTDPGLAEAAGRAIAMFGGPAAIQRLWDTAPLPVRVARWLGERDRPANRGVLQAGLAAVDQAGDAAPAGLREELLVALTRLGDVAAADRLLAAPGALSLDRLRSCRVALTAALRPAHLEALRRLTAGPDRLDDAHLAQVVGWLAARPDLDTESILRPLTAVAEPDEIRMVALSGLLRRGGDEARARHAALRARFGRPLGEAEHEWVYEVLASAPEPLRPLELETLAQLLLIAPLAEMPAPAAAAEFPRAADFPLHLPIVDLLRRDPTIGAREFERVARAVAGHPRRAALSGRRLTHLVAEMARFEVLRARLAPVFADLLAAAPDRTVAGLGLAAQIAGEAAESIGDWQTAAAEYDRAARSLLRVSLPPMVARTVLGGSYPAAGEMPRAGLAAGPYLCRARGFAAAGDLAAARDALQRAAELGEGDRATEQAVRQLSERIQR